MRSRPILSVVCLGLLLGTWGLLCVESATVSVATRYHAARRTAHFYRQAASSRVVRNQIIAPVGSLHGNVGKPAQSAKVQPAAGEKQPIR